MATVALNFSDLPEDKIARREMLERRTKPNPERPPMPKAREARLAGLEEATAQCYTDIEEATFRLKKLVSRIQAEPCDSKKDDIETP